MILSRFGWTVLGVLLLVIMAVAVLAGCATLSPYEQDRATWCEDRCCCSSDEIKARQVPGSRTTTVGVCKSRNHARL